MIKDPAYYDSLDKRTKEYKDYIKAVNEYDTFKEQAEVSTNGKKFKDLSPEDKIKLAKETLDSAASMIDWDKATVKKHTFSVPFKEEFTKKEKEFIDMINKGSRLVLTEENIYSTDWDKLTKKKDPKKILRPLTKEQHKQYKAYKEKRTLDVYNKKDVNLLVTLYAHAFALQHDKTELNKESKGSFKKLSKMSKELDIVFITYEKDLSDLKIK